MGIDIQEELKRFTPIQIDNDIEKEDDLVSVLTSIMNQFRDIKKADIKIVGGVKEVPLKVVEELKVILKNNHLIAENNQSKQECREILNVLMNYFDFLNNQLKVADSTNSPNRKVFEEQLKIFISMLQQIELIPFESMGETYNPFEHDGFVIDTPENYINKGIRKMEIVNELKKGFRYKGKVIRKPMVQFYE